MPSFRPAHLRTCVAIVGVCILGSSLCANTPPPSHVQGLHRAGLGARQVRVSVRDDQGRVRPEMQPGIAVIKNARWSPNDAERDGASEFEVLLSAARLLEQHALPGLVGIGNQHGAFLPAAELALSRVAAMGLPVVKVSAAGSVAANDENLFIEAGTLSTFSPNVFLALAPSLRPGTYSPPPPMSWPRYAARLIATKPISIRGPGPASASRRARIGSIAALPGGRGHVGC